MPTSSFYLDKRFLKKDGHAALKIAVYFHNRFPDIHLPESDVRQIFRVIELIKRF